MKTNIKQSRLNRRALILIVTMLFPLISFAQLRIDWQYCYGAEGSGDYATSILPIEDDFFVFGTVYNPKNSGMVSCEVDHNWRTPWLIRINDHGEILDQQCWQSFHPTESLSIKKAKTDNNEYYINTHMYGEVTIHKIDDGLNEIWSRKIGFFGTDMLPTDDGGVLLGNSMGHLGKDYSDYDSLLKLDSNGNPEWKISIGLEVTEIAQAKDGGFLIGGLNWDSVEGYLLKLTRDGQTEWSYVYDVAPSLIQELEDGFMLASTTSFAGEGAHGQSDILLTRTDETGNILWSHYYGGSNYDLICNFFPNPNSGFTIFGYTNSNDGDVQSNVNGYIHSDLWIFNVDASGQLMWERTIGTPSYNEFCSVVAKTAEYKYVIAGSMYWEETPSGDVNCSNSAEIPNSGQNYWVLHVTDTINSAGVPEPLSQVGAQVFPNPTKDVVHIQGIEPVEVLVYDALGQCAKTCHGTNEIPLGDLPKGMYLIKAVLKDGKVYMDKVVKE